MPIPRAQFSEEKKRLTTFTAHIKTKFSEPDQKVSGYCAYLNEAEPLQYRLACPDPLLACAIYWAIKSTLDMPSNETLFSPTETIDVNTPPALCIPPRYNTAFQALITDTTKTNAFVDEILLQYRLLAKRFITARLKEITEKYPGYVALHPSEITILKEENAQTITAFSKEMADSALPKIEKQVEQLHQTHQDFLAPICSVTCSVLQDPFLLCASFYPPNDSYFTNAYDPEKKPTFIFQKSSQPFVEHILCPALNQYFGINTIVAKPNYLTLNSDLINRLLFSKDDQQGFMAILRTRAYFYYKERIEGQARTLKDENQLALTPYLHTRLDALLDTYYGLDINDAALISKVQAIAEEIEQLFKTPRMLDRSPRKIQFFSEFLPPLDEESVPELILDQKVSSTKVSST